MNFNRLGLLEILELVKSLMLLLDNLRLVRGLLITSKLVLSRELLIVLVSTKLMLIVRLINWYLLLLNWVWILVDLVLLGVKLTVLVMLLLLVELLASIHELVIQLLSRLYMNRLLLY